ncbi:MEDS domain-containing protein [Actinoplanes sp. NPDC049681]|uniref:MEDS domain-containing protein n=1 Tax=Actinoplanes sp. NPDC049681 TaxID=3363905 RepID=UPI0037B5B7D4
MAETIRNGPPRPYGHVCLAYDDPATFEAAARDFLAEGVAAGERVWYLASEPPCGWDFRPDLIRPGDHYPAGGAIDPVRGVEAYAAATRQALADGYSGLRVAAAATPLVRTPAQLDAFARYEHIVDRYMRTHPFAALCGFDRAELGAAAVEELACLHPQSDAPFRLYATPPAIADAGLAGDLDMATRDLFARTLERAELRPAAGDLMIDGAGLAFIDHNSLLDLDAYARRRGVTAVLRTPLFSPAHLAELLELTALRVEGGR